MENNQNKDNHFNLGSDNTSSIDLKSRMPDWLLGFFKVPNVCQLADINTDLIEGYPIDDDY